MEIQKRMRIKANSGNDKKYRNWDDNDNDQNVIDESVQTESGNSNNEGDLEYFTE